MKTWVHALVSSILAVIFYPIYSWKVLFILAGGILIDIDHYFWYVYKFKDLSLFRCYKYYIRGMNKEKIMEYVGILLVFHTMEFLLVMLLLSFYNEFALIFTIGLLSHYLLDLIWQYNVAKCHIPSTSIIARFIKNKSQKV